MSANLRRVVETIKQNIVSYKAFMRRHLHIKSSEAMNSMCILSESVVGKVLGDGSLSSHFFKIRKKWYVPHRVVVKPDAGPKGKCFVS